MHRTIFDTPVVNTLLRAGSRAFLRLKGWTVQGSLPPGARKSVLIAAPHTPNWDLPYTLMVAFCLRLNIDGMGKASIFRWPFGPLMRWLGGIAVDRSRSTNRSRPRPPPSPRRKAPCNWSCRPRARAGAPDTGRPASTSSPSRRGCPS